MTRQDETRQGPLNPATEDDTVVVHNPPDAPMHMSADEADLSGIRMLDAASTARDNKARGKRK